MNLSLITLTTVSLIFSHLGYSYEVHHLIKPFTNFETAATNNVCGTLKNSRMAIYCNPALFPYVKTRHIGINVMGKSEGKSIENTRELLFSQVEVPYLEKLFAQNSFSSFTLNSNIELHTPYFLLTYSPYYILADFLIINPVFPEIAMALYKRSTLKITQGRDFATYLKAKHWNISIGGSLSGFIQEGANTFFSLMDLSKAPAKYLIKMQKTWGILADLGLFIGHKDLWYIPRFSAQLKNLGPKTFEKNEHYDLTRRIHLVEIFETYGLFGLGEELETPLGSFYLGTELTYSGVFNKPRWPPSFSGKYTLGLLSAYIGLSNFSKTAGVLVSSKNSAIGLLYGREKEIRRFNVEDDHVVYIGLEVRTP